MVVRRFLSANGCLDLVSNDGDSYPDGLDAGIYSFRAVEKIYREASLPSDREHITPYIWNHPELFSVEVIPCSEKLSRFRLTVDYGRPGTRKKSVCGALPVKPLVHSGRMSSTFSRDTLKSTS